MNRQLLAAICGVVLCSICFTNSSLGQEAAPASASDKTGRPTGSKADRAPELTAIRAGSESFARAFNKGDAKGVAAHWTEDGEYIDEMGRKFAGREAIAREYAAFFGENEGAKIRFVIDSLKLLSEGAAIEDGRAMLDPPPAGAPAMSKYTAIHVKVDGQWLMSTVRDYRIETPSAYKNVADLEWLIGMWTAEEQGTKTESVCRWVAGKSFVERRYSTTRADGTSASGIQLIGFNPQAGHVQSWNFSSDGGHAMGIWTPREGGWSAEIRGVTGDGAPTTAVNLLTKLDDNAYAWQSVNRSAGGQSLPDTEEVILRRSGK